MSTSDRRLSVFLCHATLDKPVVRELSGRLADEVWIDIWLDENKLLPGQDWRLKIEEAVETSDIVIICLSQNSVHKDGYIQKELRYAKEIALEKPEGTIFIIPLRLDNCDVPRGLHFYQWADYFGDKKEDTYHALIESLRVRHKQKTHNANIKPDEYQQEQPKKPSVEQEVKKLSDKKISDFKFNDQVIWPAKASSINTTNDASSQKRDQKPTTLKKEIKKRKTTDEEKQGNDWGEFTLSDSLVAQPKKNNTMLIVTTVTTILICCCASVLVWQFGDQILYELGLSLY